MQALRLCTDRTAHRGSRGIALLFLDHGTRRRWGVSSTSQPLFTPGKDPVPIVQEAVWAPGPVWTGAENLAPTGIRYRTVQPVACRYTDWATGPTFLYLCVSLNNVEWIRKWGIKRAKGNKCRQCICFTIMVVRHPCLRGLVKWKP